MIQVRSMFFSRLCLLFFLFSLFIPHISASRNVNRYFLFLERPEEYVTKGKSYFYPGLFINGASTAFRRGGGNTGIPELWGKYDLKKVITGAKAAFGEMYNPFEGETGGPGWEDKKLLFYVDGKVKSRGVILSLEEALVKNGGLFGGDLSVGAFVPFMHVNTSLRFTFNKENSHADAREAKISEIEMFDRVRRTVHKDLGLCGGDWSRSGIGDIDLHLRFRRYIDHQYKMRGIDLNLQTGLLIPTGLSRDNSYASSVPFGGNGHLCWYGDMVTEFELKQNWKFGVMVGLMYQFSKTHRNMRFPYHDEPPLFGAVIGDVKIEPGLTLKLAPYFTLENLMDGLHFQVRYNYLRHSGDRWLAQRACDCSLLANRVCMQKSMRYYSRWISHYVTLQAMYNSVDAMKKWFLEPTMYALFDYAYDGRGVCKTHQFTVGVELHF